MIRDTVDAIMQAVIKEVVGEFVQLEERDEHARLVVHQREDAVLLRCPWQERAGFQLRQGQCRDLLMEHEKLSYREASVGSPTNTASKQERSCRRGAGRANRTESLANLPWAQKWFRSAPDTGRERRL